MPALREAIPHPEGSTGGVDCRRRADRIFRSNTAKDHARRSDCSRSKDKAKRSPRKRARRQSDVGSNEEGGSPFKLKIHVPAHMRIKRPRPDTEGGVDNDCDQSAEALKAEAEDALRGGSQDFGSLQGGADAEANAMDDVEMTAETEIGPTVSDHEMSAHKGKWYMFSLFDSGLSYVQMRVVSIARTMLELQTERYRSLSRRNQSSHPCLRRRFSISLLPPIRIHSLRRTLSLKIPQLRLRQRCRLLVPQRPYQHFRIRLRLHLLPLARRG